MKINVVGDPMHIALMGEKVLGKHSRFVMDWVTDSDASSMYPSLMIAFAIHIMTMIGRVEFENMTDPDEFTKVVDAIAAGDISFIATEYLGLPSYEELIDVYQEIKDEND